VEWAVAAVGVAVVAAGTSEASSKTCYSFIFTRPNFPSS
jgi:hypothetical protein